MYSLLLFWASAPLLLSAHTPCCGAFPSIWLPDRGTVKQPTFLSQTVGNTHRETLHGYIGFIFKRAYLLVQLFRPCYAPGCREEGNDEMGVSTRSGFSAIMGRRNSISNLQTYAVFLFLL